MADPVRVIRATEAAKFEIPTVGAGGLPALPPFMLVPPGAYAWQGAGLDMSAPGLYWISDYVSVRAQRIVPDQADPRVLLSAIARLAVHGDADDGISGGANSAATAMTRTLSHTCGDAAPLGKYLLEQGDFVARIVDGFTLDEMNSYDNGHTMLEVVVGAERWAVDTDLKYTFHDPATGDPLDLVTLYDRLLFGDVEFRPLTDRPCVTDPGFFWSWLIDEISDDPLRWYDRSFGIISINGNALCETAAQTTRAQLFGLTPMTRAAFLAAFYPPLGGGSIHYGKLSNGVTGWSNLRTIYDLSNPIPANTLVESVGPKFNSARPVKIKIGRRVGNNMDCVWSAAGQTQHNGGSAYQQIACGFTTPNDGATYYPGYAVTINGNEAFYNGVAMRAMAMGDLTGSQPFSFPNDGAVPTSWVG